MHLRVSAHPPVLMIPWLGGVTEYMYMYVQMASLRKYRSLDHELQAQISTHGHLLGQ